MRRIIACTILLAGCANASQLATGATPPPPADYRQQAKDKILATFKDPYSIRDAAISSPQWDGTPLPLPNGMFAAGVWAVCVKANAKNSFGAYTGASYTAVVFIDGKVDSLQDYPRWQQFCSRVPMEPFPEIMQKA